MMQTFGGATALMYACQQCKEAEVLQILRKQPYSVKDRDRTLKTPLHYCAENPNPSCAEVLLKTAPELVNAQDENGYCTLHLAVIAGNKPLIKLLITKGADLNLHDNEGHSAVHWAIVSSEKEALEMIIRAGANPSTPDIHGGYPLHYAVQMCGSGCDHVGNAFEVIRVVETLINFGVDVNVKDKDGRQPILWAASAGSADAVIYLVSSGACVEAADKDGLTALHCAASRGHTTTLETLISLCGANVDLIDGNGCSAIFYSVTLGHADATELLLQLGAQPNRQDRKGRTPAHCGAAKGQLETLRILQKHGGNLWMRNVKGDIPLHEAVASGRKDLVLWLLSQNSEAINIANNDGRCPLHIASMYNNTEMVKVLLDSKSLVNPVMRTHKGILMTPLNVALCKGHRSCGKYLQLHGGVPFSKVSKMEPEPVFAVRVSPSDDMMINKIEKSKENLTSPQSKISKSRSSTDVQRNQDKMKIENMDKKKVYRRRKKKKSPSNKNTQESDSEDSIHSVKVKTVIGRKSEKSIEDGDDDVENDEDEEKMKLKKVQLEAEAIKKENNSKNSSFDRKITPTRKNKTSEEIATSKSLTKIKTESKFVQRNKSFNETKNVSDLSPEDFPPLMQAVNQLDSVIMEPDMEISKSENDYSELRPQDVGVVGLTNGSDPAVKKNEQEILEKINSEVKAVSNDAVSEEDLKENRKKHQDFEGVEKDGLLTQEQFGKARMQQSNEGICKNKMSTGYAELRNSNEEGVLEKCIKSPESLTNENFVEKTDKKNNDISEKKVGNEKTVILTSVGTEEAASLREINFTNLDVGEIADSKAKIDAEVEDDEADKHKNKPDLKGFDYFNEIDRKKVDLDVDDLCAEVTKTEVLVENKDEKEKAKIFNVGSNDLGSSPKKEESSGHFSKNVIVSLEENTGPSDIQIVEETRTAYENETLIVPIEKGEAEISPFDKKDVNDNKSSKALDSFGITENNEKSSGDDLLLETLKKQRNPHEAEEKPLTVTEHSNKENIPQLESKKFSDIKENSEVEVKQSAMSSNTKSEDAINQKTEDSPSNEKNERSRISEIMRNYENPESKDDEIPQKSNSSEHKQFKTSKVSRLCRRNRDLKEDLNQISVTQLVQNTIRKYHMERGIFYQLLELKRYQIRSGRANEQVLVKRLADEYERSRVFLGMKPFSGLYKFREFEKFLYDQLKALNTRRSLIIPDIKSYDDIDALSGFLKKSRYKIISEIPQGDTTCTCITQRCHHSACAYTSVPCSAYVTDLRRQKHRKPRRECFFPRIDQPPPVKPETQRFTELPATLELVQGSEKHVITLPQSSPSGGKRYYVTFTIKGAPAFKKQDFVENSKDYFKHRHAKSV